MKKKFVLTLALVLMVAVTLSAATPLEVSGKVSAGYTFAFGDGATPSAVANSGQATVNATFSGDAWKVELKNAKYEGGKQDPVTALLTIDLGKTLAAEGVDMGDVSLTLHAGTGVGQAAPTVSANVSKQKKDVKMTAGNNFGLTIGYAKLGTLYVSYDPVGGKSFVVGAKLAPVDGVTAALGFTNDQGRENAFGVSAAADIAKLADLDFTLKSTVEYVGVLTDPVGNHLLLDVAGDYEGIGLWVAYKTDFDKHGVTAKASYETEIEGFDLYAGAKIGSADVSNFGKNYKLEFEAGVSKVMSGVTYALDLGYKLKGLFTVTPSVTISF